MATATLQAIEDKVRKLTRSPSTNQLAQSTIYEYINTFIAYDFPENIRLNWLHRTVSFNLSPNVASYAVADVLDPNISLSFNPPVYIAGYKALFSQSEDEFYNIYPFTNSIYDTGNVGDGVTTDFTGTLSTVPVLQSNVQFVTKEANNDPLVLFDNGAGVLIGESGAGANTINYLTGAYALSYIAPPAAGEQIVAQVYTYQPSRPQAVLYYQGKFVFRPVPDQSYRVDIESFQKPTELFAAASTPELEQWWQYIAYGASKKIFEDRMDLESVQKIMPEFTKQERLVLRRTIVQQTPSRAATIYSEQASENGNPNNWPSW